MIDHNRIKIKRGEEGKFGRGFQKVLTKYTKKKQIELIFLLNMLNSYLEKVKKCRSVALMVFCAMLKKRRGGGSN